MDGTGSMSCSAVDFGISRVEVSEANTRQLVKNKITFSYRERHLGIGIGGF
jgi:hypothetical protein